jgi:hypothetical protein
VFQVGEYCEFANYADDSLFSVANQYLNATMSTHTFYLLGPWNTISVEKPEQWLGRTVRNHEKPTADFTPSDTAAIRGQSYDDPGYKDIDALITSTRGSSVHMLLATR